MYSLYRSNPYILQEVQSLYSPLCMYMTYVKVWTQEELEGAVALLLLTDMSLTLAPPMQSNI